MNTLSVEFNQSLFNLSDTGQSYLNLSNRNILKNLITGIQKGSKTLLLIGDHNCGKTTLIQRAIDEIQEKTLLVDIDQENLDYEQLINLTGTNLNNDFSLDDPIEIKSAHLKELIQSKSIKHVVFLIDLSLKFQSIVLKETLKIVNSNIFGSSYSHLIITGLPDLKTKINESNLFAETFDNSNTFQIENFSEEDIRSYINFHLKDLENQDKNLFSETAIERIILYSKGLPGLINRLCSLGLLTANIEEKSVVTEEMMDEVLENSLFLGNEFNYTPPETPIPSAPPIEAPNITPSSSLQSLSNVKNKVLNTKNLDSNTNQKTPETNITPTRTFQTKPNNKQTAELTNIQKPPVENKLLEPDWLENSLFVSDRRKDVEEKIVQTEQRLPKSKIKVVKKNRREVDVSKKSLIFYTFLMGMVFSGLLGTGWYFLNLKKLPFDDGNTFEVLTDKNESIDVPESSDTATKAKNTIIEETVEDSDSIQEYLQQAELQLSNKKLMTPTEDNAWSTYKKVLEINPNNQQALSGIYQIKETYVGWARAEINKNNTTQAIFFLKKALEISPDDPEILDTISMINNSRVTVRRKTREIKEYIPELGYDVYKLLDEPNGISKLLIIAERQIERKNLTKPVNNSALSIYKVILDRYPNHKQSILGIKKIKNKYLSWAKYEIKKGDFRHAEFLYSKALEVAPSDPEILSDIDRLRQTTGDF
ncbi:MAG: hypothetical protein L3J59_08080 [Methylococcaceae bacterium]|nr:hypothetical protein [Methylococcaceae bacterium]